MNERIIWRLQRTATGIYNVERLELERSLAGGKTEQCGAAWPGYLKKTDVPFPNMPSARLLALIFVRVARLRYVSLNKRLTPLVPILPVAGRGSAFMRFKGFYQNLPERGSSWMRTAFLFRSGIREKPRLLRWFELNTKRNGGVLCDIRQLLPDKIDFYVGDDHADEAEIDRIETSLSIICNADSPADINDDGLRSGGRRISIGPDWIGQEKQCSEADEVLSSSLYRILSVTGNLGKTVFAVRWIRRLFNKKPRRYQSFFQWSFNRAPHGITSTTPLDECFDSLACFFGVEVPRGLPLKHYVPLILSRLPENPALFLLDGIEAIFSGTDMAKTGGDGHCQAFVSLLKGIAGSPDTFAVVTSRSRFSDICGISRSTVYLYFVTFDPWGLTPI